MTVLVPSRWPSTAVPELAEHEVHVWSIALGADAQAEAQAEAGDLVLSEAERERAGRLEEEHLAERWSRARSALRRILAAYAGADPAALVVEPAACVHCGEPHGKPFLAGPDGGWLRFNVSHSEELAVVAVAHGREVGVDVEAARGARRLEGIAERWFTPAEVLELRRLAGPERQAEFYRLWARKEAHLKATARGIIAGRLDEVSPESRPGWDFADLDVGEGYAAALAVAPPGFSPARAPAGDGPRSP